MRKMKAWRHAAILVLAVPLLAMCNDVPTMPGQANATPASSAPASVAHAAATQTLAVSGTGVHFFTTAIVHTQESIENGMIQRGTDIVRLDGDLIGYILYHATSTFDFDGQTLVNTGTQIFSGTIAGSDPVVLHDDTFRFQVDLVTGETLGHVHFGRSNDAPHKGGWYECDLVVVGTGLTPEGDATVDYSGECTRRGTAG